MILVPNWRRVLKRAWSIRLMLLAALLSGVEVALSFSDVKDLLDLPPGTFAALAGVVSAAALVARLIAQNGVTDADQSHHQQ